MVRFFFGEKLNSIIPIFPLNIVVFPYSKIPLHIFEERYKKLISQCIEKKEGFGIVLNLNDRLYEIGCYVEVSEVLKRYPKGEMDIVVAGRERFLIKETSKHPFGYFLASVREYQDINPGTSSSLIENLESSFHKILKKSNYNPEDSFWLHYKQSFIKSFKIAEKSGLSLMQQQELLSLRNEDERINYLIQHFRNLEIKLEENAALKAIIMGDGYLNLQ